MIQVIQQGLLDTIQDGGRYGYQHLGINPGGAMDRAAMYVANILVGNDPEAAVIELHFPAAVLLFEEDTLIALSGGDFGAMVNEQPLDINQPIWISQLSILRFTKPVSGARCYIAIRGGLNNTPWLGSHSTHLKAGAGGFEGRKLQKNDRIPVNHVDEDIDKALHQKYLHTTQLGTPLPWRADVRDLYSDGSVIRVVTSLEYPALTPQSQSLFTSHFFTLSEQCDRMGYRLKGPALQMVHEEERLSAGITRGTVQLLPDGHLIILMADHQTTGGYPRIAHVVSADLPILAQLQPHSKITFQIIPHDEAEELLIAAEQHLHFLQNACNLRWQEWLQHNQK